MQKRLALAAPAGEIAAIAIFLNLTNVTAHHLPAFDLSLIIRHTTAHVITAIPLKPAARIIRVNPALAPPFGQRLTRTNAEIVQRRIALARRKFGAREPAFGKFFLTIRHIFAAKYAERQHLLWRQIRLKFRIEIPPHGSGEAIAIAFLHFVADGDGAGFHGQTCVTSSIITPNCQLATPFAKYLQRYKARGMDSYSVIKTIHIISGTILFGTGFGIAFFFFCAHRNTDLTTRFFAARTTVLADFIFTLPAVILQLLTGFWLIHHAGYGWSENWLVATYIIYIIAGLCWLPVVWIQIRLKTILKNCIKARKSLPDSYCRLFRLWFALGWPAFAGLVAVFFLMVVKPA